MEFYMIKKVLGFFLISLFSAHLYAQDAFPKNAIKLNVAGIFFGDGNLGYERALDDKSSIQANTAFGYVKDDGYQYQMNAFTMSYRKYFNGNFVKGYYVQGDIGVAVVSADDKVNKETTTSYLWRLNGGYKHTFNGGFTLEAGAGLDGFGNDFKDNRYDGFYTPLYPYLNLGFGYSF